MLIVHCDNCSKAWRTPWGWYFGDRNMSEFYWKFLAFECVWIWFRIVCLKTRDTGASSWLFYFCILILARYKNENSWRRHLTAPTAHGKYKQRKSLIMYFSPLMAFLRPLTHLPNRLILSLKMFRTLNKQCRTCITLYWPCGGGPLPLEQLVGPDWHRFLIYMPLFPPPPPHPPTMRSEFHFHIPRTCMIIIQNGA